MREFVLEKVKPFADEMKTDAVGEHYGVPKGQKALERPVVLCAHMDEVGVIIKKITDDGMLNLALSAVWTRAWSSADRFASVMCRA